MSTLTNLLTRPSFELTQSLGTITRTNLCTRPRGTDITAWNLSGFGTGGAGTSGLVSLGGGISGFRVTWTTAASSTSQTVSYGHTGAAVGDALVTPGDVVTAALDMDTNMAVRVALRLSWFNAGGTAVSNMDVWPDEMVGTRRKYVTATAPANTVRVRISAIIQSTTNFANGFELTVSRPLVEVNALESFEYFDGTTAGATWTGTADASTSQMVIPTPTPVRTNLHLNPEPTSYKTTGWSSFTPFDNTNVVYNPTGSPSGTWSRTATAQSANTAGLIDTSPGGAGQATILVTPGVTYTASIWFRTSAGLGGQVQAAIQWYTNITSLDATSAGPPVTVTPGVWTRLTVTAAASANAARLRFVVRKSGAWLNAIGEDWTLAEPLVEVGDCLGPYIGPSTPSTDDMLVGTLGDNSTLAWRPTSAYARNLTLGITAPASNRVAMSSTEWAYYGTKSVRVQAFRTDGDSYADYTGGLPDSSSAGKTYTMLGVLRQNDAITDLSAYARNIRIQVQTPGGPVEMIPATTTAPNSAGNHLLKYVFTVPADCTGWNFLRLYHGGVAGSADVFWDSLTLVEGDLSSLLTGPFDGENGDLSNLAWTGTPHDSTSTADGPSWLVPMTFGRVKARFLAIVGDTDDMGDNPDAVPLQGTVTFTPAGLDNLFRYPDAIPDPAFIAVRPVEVELDEDGYLDVMLVATDQFDEPFEWRASFAFEHDGRDFSLPEQVFELPTGDTVDLSEL